MSKLYLSELQAQLRLVKERLAEIHIPRGPVAPPTDPKIIETRKHLLERKRIIEQRIIDYDPPDHSEPKKKP